MLSTPQYCSLCLLTALVTSTTVFGWCVQYLGVRVCAEAGDILCYSEVTVHVYVAYTLLIPINCMLRTCDRCLGQLINWYQKKLSSNIKSNILLNRQCLMAKQHSGQYD